MEKFSLQIAQKFQLGARPTDARQGSVDDQCVIPIQRSKIPFTAQEKAQILEYYHEIRSVRLTQRWVRRTMLRYQP